MIRSYSQDYLDRFDAKGGRDCPCGRRHVLVTRGFSLRRGAVGELRDQLLAQYPAGIRIWTLSDENTRAAAGQACEQALGNLVVGGTVLPASPRPATTVELAERLSRDASAARPDLVLAIGAGTVSDLGKMISLNLDVPNWCVATAPSADAYGSGNAAVKFDYRARSLPGRPSERIVCDLDVLERAPRNLFLSGLGDLLAKYLAFLDWNVSALVTGEYYCPEAAELALESARRAIQAAALQADDFPAAVRYLMDALVTSSFAMQAVENSRPASTAEHTVCHYWEISHTPRNADRTLHGLLVGLASRILLAGYSAFYASLPSVGGGEGELGTLIAGAAGNPDWEKDLDPAMAPLRRWIAEEADEGLYSPGMVRSHLEGFQEHRQRIAELSRDTLAELEQAVQVLAGTGFPFSPDDYGLDPDDVVRPFRYVRALRRRYSSFNLMHELGVEEECLQAIRREIGRLG